MGFQDLLWNITMSGLVILTAPVFLDIMQKPDRHRQTVVNTLTPDSRRCG